MSTSVRVTLTIDELEHVKAALIKLQISDEAVLASSSQRIAAYRSQRAEDMVVSVERETLEARTRLVRGETLLPKVFGVRYRQACPRKVGRR